MNRTKQCDIPFVDGIPEHWSTIANRYLFTETTEKVGNSWSDYQLLSLTTKGVREKSINTGGGKVPDSYDKYLVISKGQMIMCLFDLDCSAVFSGISTYDGMITSAYNAYNSTGIISNEYADYWFQYVFSNRYYKMYSKNIRYTVTSDMFKAIKTPIPPKAEQAKIVEILDKKTAQIEELITNQEQQIAKLKEYRTSLITEVITKGLNPNVEMCDSGIDYIGEMPVSRKLLRGKDVLTLLEKPVREDDGVITCFRDGMVTLRSNRREEGFTFAEKEIGYQGIDVGDLVVHGMDGFAGSIGISDSRGKGSPVLNVLDSTENKKYLMYYLRALAYNNIFVALSTGIRVRSCDLRWKKLAELYFQIPSIQEQEEIVAHLDKKCAQIDELIAIKEEKIKKLNDYKKSLIYEYVTGKKEVV